mmetsp:Transcript_9051/g.29971  ORF Transcript_9051/g.29971 Transcript_9051/m.29971 type:complete len:212 (+) Transcript_9051:68-703(+)
MAAMTSALHLSAARTAAPTRAGRCGGRHAAVIMPSMPSAPSASSLSPTSLAAHPTAPHPALAAVRAAARCPAPSMRGVHCHAAAAGGESAAAALEEKTVLVPVATGTGEIEAVAVIEVLRRAGAKVTVAAVNDDGAMEVVCSRGVKLVADVNVKEISGRGAPTWDLIAIPGGMPGAEIISDHIKLHTVLEKHFKAGKPMGGICAAPVIGKP